MTPLCFTRLTVLLVCPLIATILNTASAEETSPENACLMLDHSLLLQDLTVLASDEFAGRKPGTEGHTKARQYITTRFAETPLSAFQNAYHHPFEYASNGHGTNIISYIKGTKSPDSFIVITAHYDHLGQKGGRIYNGADDNASGVAAMLALAQRLTQTPPRHSVIFIATDAEEDGLHGARAFFKTLPVASTAIALNINLDMVGRGGNRNRLLLIHDGVHPFLKSALTAVKEHIAVANVRPAVRNARSRLFALTRSDRENWREASDYAVFGDQGVPFVHIGTATHADYHEPSDTVMNIDTDFFTQSAGIAHCVFRALDQALSVPSR